MSNKSDIVYVSDFPRKNGDMEDGFAIQRAIDKCIANGGGTLEFEHGKNYIVNTELQVDGNFTDNYNALIINGNNCTLLKEYSYQNGSKGGILTIEGESEPAKGILVKNLNLKFTDEIKAKEIYTNGFGICNAACVTLDNCTVDNAPQTSFAVTAKRNKIIDQVSLQNCVGKNSKEHTFRLSALEGSTHFDAKMYNCLGKNTTGPNKDAYSIGGKRAHLLCNVTPNYGNFLQVVQNCVFDETGKVFITKNAKAYFNYCKFAYPKQWEIVDVEVNGKPVKKGKVFINWVEQ